MAARENKAFGTMNFFIAVMLALAALGLADKIFGGRLGLAEEFDKGLSTMGPLALSMVGVYCIGVTVVQKNADALAALSQVLPFDASLPIGCLLAPDLGGYAMAQTMAATPALGIFSGLIVSSTLGTVVSFSLPIALTFLNKTQHGVFMRGFCLGVVTLPLGVGLGGFLLGLTPGQLGAQLLPIGVLCLVLCAGLLWAARITTRALLLLGNGVRILSFALFGVVAAGIFVPAWQLASPALVQEVFLIVAKITCVVCGAMILSKLVLERCGGLLRAVGRLLDINDYAVLGLLLSLATSISMLPLYEKMDARGKAMNAAFMVSGAFVLGGQLAFVASVESTAAVAVYMAAKLAGGVAAVLCVRFLPFAQTQTIEQGES